MTLFSIFFILSSKTHKNTPFSLFHRYYGALWFMMMNNFYFFTFYEQSVDLHNFKKNIFSDFLDELVIFIEEKVTIVGKNY
jgi:hypothetical protein